MRLLVITQKVDILDDNLGFFHRWIEKFAEKLEEVYVICLSRGKYELPRNVRVFSLGKEEGISKIGQLIRFQKYLIRILPEVSGIFVHMCPIYVLASFPLAKIFRKKTILWYAHPRPGFLVKPVMGLVSKIFTPSKDSFVYKSKKVVVTGHGIDIETFKPEHKMVGNEKSQILSTGRISPIKDFKTLLGAIDILINQKDEKDIKVKIVGSPIEDYEKRYFEQLKGLIGEKKLEDYIEFQGGIPNREIANLYRESDIFVNMQAKGGAGKAVLEAMACGVPVVLCTKTFNDLLSDFKDEVIFEEKNPQDFADKLLNCLNFPEAKRNDYSNLLRSIVVRYHNLDNLIDRICQEF